MGCYGRLDQRLESLPSLPILEGAPDIFPDFVSFKEAALIEESYPALKLLLNGLAPERHRENEESLDWG